MNIYLSYNAHRHLPRIPCRLLAQLRFLGGKLEEDRGCIREHPEDRSAIAKLRRKADCFWEWGEGLLSDGGRRLRMVRLAARNPSEVTTQNINRDGGKHKDCANPEAPVTMHTPPIGARIGLATIAAISFEVVLAAGHPFSIFAKVSLALAMKSLSPAPGISAKLFPDSLSF